MDETAVLVGIGGLSHYGTRFAQGFRPGSGGNCNFPPDDLFFLFWCSLRPPLLDRGVSRELKHEEPYPKITGDTRKMTSNFQVLGHRVQVLLPDPSCHLHAFDPRLKGLDPLGFFLVCPHHEKKMTSIVRVIDSKCLVSRIPVKTGGHGGVSTWRFSPQLREAEKDHPFLVAFLAGSQEGMRPGMTREKPSPTWFLFKGVLTSVHSHHPAKVIPYCGWTNSCTTTNGTPLCVGICRGINTFQGF